MRMGVFHRIWQFRLALSAERTLRCCSHRLIGSIIGPSLIIVHCRCVPPESVADRSEAAERLPAWVHAAQACSTGSLGAEGSGCRPIRGRQLSRGRRGILPGRATARKMLTEGSENHIEGLNNTALREARTSRRRPWLRSGAPSIACGLSIAVEATPLCGSAASLRWGETCILCRAAEVNFSYQPTATLLSCSVQNIVDEQDNDG
jgi:hypothetical protein